MTSAKHRCAIVTGGGRGIGKGIAKGFADAGYCVLVVARNQAEVDAVAAEIGGGASGFSADVSMLDGAKAMAAAALERYGSIDALLANAGVFPAARLEEMTEGDFDHVIGVNLKSALFSAQSCLPAMKSAGKGRIVLTSSITG